MENILDIYQIALYIALVGASAGMGAALCLVHYVLTLQAMKMQTLQNRINGYK